MDYRMYDLIEKKKHKSPLTEDEIRWMITEYTAGRIPDYQMSAMTMAIWFNGMTDEETTWLTMAMAESGEMLDPSSIPGTKVDKHSTGGIGDKTTLIVTPILAALNVPTAKMSGRGLGFTGGTVDKLESIPGVRSEFSEEEFLQIVREVGFIDAAQTKALAPADKLLYALRDVTATVDSIPLIASSIMSKKLAAGADRIVLDVKCGSGAFMGDFESARALADQMIRIGELAGRKVVAVISDMNQPLGHAVGNTVEVLEALEVLKGAGEERLRTLCLAIATEMLQLSDQARGSREEAEAAIKAAVSSGAAYEKFVEYVRAVGGDESYIRNAAEQIGQKQISNSGESQGQDTSQDIAQCMEGAFPVSSVQQEQPVYVYAEKEGYLSSCNNAEVGMTSVMLGAGREKKGDVIDMEAGILILKKLGDYVKKGEPLAVFYTKRMEMLPAAKERFLAAYEISPERPETVPVILEILGSDI